MLQLELAEPELPFFHCVYREIQGHVKRTSAEAIFIRSSTYRIRACTTASWSYSDASLIPELRTRSFGSSTARANRWHDSTICRAV
jgi:hypothetical protein